LDILYSTHIFFYHLEAIQYQRKAKKIWTLTHETGLLVGFKFIQDRQQGLCSRNTLLLKFLFKKIDFTALKKEKKRPQKRTQKNENETLDRIRKAIFCPCECCHPVFFLPLKNDFIHLYLNDEGS
jgi:hypothetical protein